MCHRGGRVSRCWQDDFRPAGHLDAAFPFQHGLLPCRPPRTPSRAIGSVPIYSFARPRQSAGVGYAVDHPMLNDVYNARILDLAGNIPRLGRLPAPDATRDGAFQAVRIHRHRGPESGGGAVSDFAHDVKACALGQASSSIMARHVIGAKPAELRELRETVRKMLKENGPPPGRQMGRHRRARAGARLQGAPRLDHAHLRCRGVRHRPDRGKVGHQTDAGRRVATSLQPNRRSLPGGNSARSPAGLRHPANRRGKFCEAPVLPRRIPVASWALCVLITIEWLPIAAKAPISVEGTRAVA